MVRLLLAAHYDLRLLNGNSWVHPRACIAIPPTASLSGFWDHLAFSCCLLAAGDSWQLFAADVLIGAQLQVSWRTEQEQRFHEGSGESYRWRAPGINGEGPQVLAANGPRGQRLFGSIRKRGNARNFFLG